MTFSKQPVFKTLRFILHLFIVISIIIIIIIIIIIKECLYIKAPNYMQTCSM